MSEPKPRDISEAPDTDRQGIDPAQLLERVMKESLRAESVLAALKLAGVPLDSVTVDALENVAIHLRTELCNVDEDDD